MNIDDYNSAAWDHEVEKQTEWTRPVSEARIADARKGNFSIVLTPQIPVPAEWFPPLQGADVLCLACGGGQQSPVLAAAGANVTVLDNSEKQLGQDRLVAEREGLDITLVKGDMRDLSVFDDSSFDLIFHPVSNGYISDVRPVWLESFRVLRPGGSLLAGFANPAQFLFDELKVKRDQKLEACYKIPFAEITDLDPASRQHFIDGNEPLLFGHLLEDQIGGQLAAGFYLTGFFEDRERTSLISEYMPTYIATRAVKPGTTSA